MFAQVVSATALLKCCGHAVPSTSRRQQLDAGHHRRGLGHGVAGLPQLLDVRVVGLAEVVPDRRGARDDVGLIAAVGDDVVRALARAAGARGGSSSRCPSARRRRARCGRATALPAACAVSPRNEYCTDTSPVPSRVAPRHVEVVADVGEQRDVDVLEQPGADEVRLGADELLGGARPDADRARAASRAP